jgi:hypothetical protein
MKVSATKTTLAVGLIVASVTSAALAAKPKVAGEGPAVPGGNPSVKPTEIIYTGDGSGLLAGLHKKPHAFNPIKWSSWRKHAANGSGANWIDNCTPSCAQGTFIGYPVTIKLFRPRVKAGYDVFTRMTLTYTGQKPSFVHTSTVTWKLVVNGTFFFWHFPS